MKTYPYLEAKKIIQPICNLVNANTIGSREMFFAALDENPHIAVQGYNSIGTISYWNAAAVDLYGYSQDQAINQNLFDLILPAEMRALARDMIAAASRTHKLPASGPCDLVKADGKLIAVYSGHVMFVPDSKCAPEFYCIDLAIDEESIPAKSPSS